MVHQPAFFFFFNLGIYSNSGWPWTHFSPFASESWVLRLYVWGHHIRLASFEFYCTVYRKKKLKEKFMSTYYNFHWTQQWLQGLSSYVCGVIDCIIYVWVCMCLHMYFFVCDGSVAQIKDLANVSQTLYYRYMPLTLTFSFSIFLWKLTSHFRSHYFNILLYSDINDVT